MAKVDIILKSGKDQSVRDFYPWIFSGAIKKMNGTPAEGDIVDVYSNKNEFLASGHYQHGAIAIRNFSFVKCRYNDDFWKNKILNAYNLRVQLGFVNHESTSLYRLVHGEGDGLPGMITDYYNGTLVMQMHSIGMHQLKESFVRIYKELYDSKLKAVYDKSKSTLPFEYSQTMNDNYLFGHKTDTQVIEYGNRFYIDIELGQKSGFFIDQRENRRLLEEYSANKSVLNLFGYTGGFSVYAIRGGATQVHTVDSSKPAIKIANKNILLNFPEYKNHQSFTVDAFDFLRETDKKYDLIVLDPPAFAKHNHVLSNAVKGYKRLNTLAMEKIKSKGIIFTFSCSQLVNRENFRKAVFSAAVNAKRDVRVLHQLTQPPDHPVNIYHPEGEYLKGLVLEVT